MSALYYIPTAPAPRLDDSKGGPWSPLLHAFVDACLQKDPVARSTPSRLKACVRCGGGVGRRGRSCCAFLNYPELACRPTGSLGGALRASAPTKSEGCWRVSETTVLCRTRRRRAGAGASMAEGCGGENTSLRRRRPGPRRRRDVPSWRVFRRGVYGVCRVWCGRPQG